MCRVRQGRRGCQWPLPEMRPSGNGGQANGNAYRPSGAKTIPEGAWAVNIPLMIVDWTGYHLHGKHVEVAERGIVSQDLPDVGPLVAVRLPNFKGDPAHN